MADDTREILSFQTASLALQLISMSERIRDLRVNIERDRKALAALEGFTSVKREDFHGRPDATFGITVRERGTGCLWQVRASGHVQPATQHETVDIEVGDIGAVRRGELPRPPGAS